MFSIFGNKTQQQPQPQAQTTQNPPPNADNSRQLEINAQNPNGQQPKLDANGNPVTEEKAVVSPLDKYKDLWEDAPVDPAVAAANKGKPSGYLGIDPSKIKENAAKMDFSKSIDPALAAKALAGDAAAFGTVINQVVQAAFAASLQATHSMVERGVKAGHDQMFEKLPGEFRKLNLSDSSFSENPALNHPSVKPMIQMLQTRFAEKYPDATVQELRQMATDYFKETMQIANPQSKDSGNSRGKPGVRGNTPQERLQNLQATGGNFDWDKFMTGTEEEENSQNSGATF